MPSTLEQGNTHTLGINNQGYYGLWNAWGCLTQADFSLAGLEVLGHEWMEASHTQP